MNPDLFIVFGSLSVTGLVLGSMALRIWSRNSKPTPGLTESQRDAIQDEIAEALRIRDQEFEELHERLDFAERVLGQARLPKGTDPPREKDG